MMALEIIEINLLEKKITRRTAYSLYRFLLFIVYAGACGVHFKNLKVNSWCSLFVFISLLIIFLRK